MAVTSSSLKPVVKIHSACGQLKGAFAWEKGPIAGLGWTDTEDLLIVETSGQVIGITRPSPQAMNAQRLGNKEQLCCLQVTLYDQHGTKLPRHFSLGEEAQRDSLLHCCIYGDGVVALTKTFALWAISDIQEPKLQRLASPNLAASPPCMAVIPPQHTLSGSVEVHHLLTSCSPEPGHFDIQSHFLAFDNWTSQCCNLQPG